MKEAVIRFEGKGYLKRDFENKIKWTKTKSLATIFDYDKAKKFIQSSVKVQQRNKYSVVSLAEETKDVAETIYEHEISLESVENAVETSIQCMNSLVGLNDDIVKYHEQFTLMLSQCDLEVQDLLHLIKDFSKFKVSAVERMRITQELENIGVKREQIKKQLELIKLMKEKNLNKWRKRMDEEWGANYVPRTKVYERLGLKLKKK